MKILNLALLALVQLSSAEEGSEPSCIGISDGECNALDYTAKASNYNAQAASVAVSSTTSSTCQPMFNHQDDQVAINNECNPSTLKFMPSDNPGSAQIVMGEGQNACAYTTAVECGGDEIWMGDIKSIDFKVTVPANLCSTYEWVAVYMFPYNGTQGGDWQNGNDEADFVETTNGAFASNWDGRQYQAQWIDADGNAIGVTDGAEQHVTFTSSVEEGGQYQWNTYVCDTTYSTCDENNAKWHSFRTYGPEWFNMTMMIVVDDWGSKAEDSPAKPGCTLTVDDMVITKTSTY